MENPDIVSKLKNLSETEAKILYLKCQGLDYEDIGTQLNYAVSTISLYAGSMYQKLGFDKQMHSSERKRILKRDYCPTVTRLYDAENGWLPDDPEPNPSSKALLVVMQEISEEKEKRLARRPPGGIVGRETDQGREPIRPLDSGHKGKPWGLYVIIGILLIVIVYLFFHQILPAPPIPLPTPQPLPTYTITPTYTLMPTNTILPVVIASTNTIMPTNTIEPTFTPTNTLPPTPTLVPTPVSLLENKFADGISPLWTVTGNPMVVDGAITWQGSEPVILTAGDSSWKNYEITASFPHFDTGSCDFFLGVRRRADGNMMALGVVRAGRLGWFKGLGTKLTWLNDEALITDSPALLDVIVNGDNFNWVGYLNLSLSGYDSGGIMVYLTCDTMDYIKVTKLP